MEFNQQAVDAAMAALGTGPESLGLLNSDDDASAVSIWSMVHEEVQRTIFGYMNDYGGRQFLDEPYDEDVEVYTNGTNDQRIALAEQIIDSINDQLGEATDPDSENYRNMDECGFFDTESQAQLRDRVCAVLKVEDHQSKTFGALFN